jgi:predicted phosphate transport protein (TIGR00153 family)
MPATSGIKETGRSMGFLGRNKKTDRFTELLIQQAEYAVEGLTALQQYASHPDSGLAAQVNKIEKEADEVRRVLIDELNQTFVTPIDREDIFALSRAIDDILDYADSTIEEMALFKAQSNSYIQRMASLLHDAAHEIHQGVLRLDDHPSVAAEHAVRAKALENRMETVYREALADLFSGADSLEKIVQILKLREIYRHLSNAADRGDEAANVIGDIVVKKL